MKIEYDRPPYKQRNRIERMFGYLKVTEPSQPAAIN